MKSKSVFIFLLPTLLSFIHLKTHAFQAHNI